jgi:hypothetical protein|tara:strand:+ start:508 stop:936 length:429 start_codon:yes stop_codon:yes gene_type:complete
MATTTATITLSSSDIADNAISISNTATLTNQGNDTGMTKTTGLTRVTLESSSNVVLIDSGAATRLNTINKGKIYIKNLNSRGDGTKFVTIETGNNSGTPVELGRLYGDDFAFFPFDGGTNKDIILDPSDATATTLEYIIFYE